MSVHRSTGWRVSGNSRRRACTVPPLSVDDDLLRASGAAGIPLLCYTVNDPELASVLYRRGVAAVFSDRIDCVAGD
jgi:glycerophosphoryl diester phosphodiesterase